jgi:hypothetical protein
MEEDLPSRTALARLARTASMADRDVFITVNNKAEGSAPLSVRRLAEQIRGLLHENRPFPEEPR